MRLDKDKNAMHLACATGGHLAINTAVGSMVFRLPTAKTPPFRGRWSSICTTYRTRRKEIGGKSDSEEDRWKRHGEKRKGFCCYFAGQFVISQFGN